MMPNLNGMSKKISISMKIQKAMTEDHFSNITVA